MVERMRIVARLTPSLNELGGVGVAQLVQRRADAGGRAVASPNCVGLTGSALVPISFGGVDEVVRRYHPDY